jgi:hypothetical protein
VGTVETAETDEAAETVETDETAETVETDETAETVETDEADEAQRDSAVPSVALSFERLRL